MGGGLGGGLGGELRRRRNLDYATGVLLAAGYFVSLLLTLDDVGFTRDEGYYFRAASDYLGWFEHLWEYLNGAEIEEPFADPVIVRYWGYNPEHPVLLKTLFGLSWKLFHDQLGWVSHSTGFRLPAMLLAAGMIHLVYCFGSEAYGRRPALFAVLALATIPRLFHHAHLACFDVGMATVQLLVLYAYWKGLESWRWSVLTGAAFGLALATKHNALFIPLILLVHSAARGWGPITILGRPPSVRLPPIPSVFVAMLLLGPLIFFIHWPYLWHDPVSRIGFYLRFHLDHVHYPIEYFRQVLYEPPFPRSFVFVMTWVTVPFATVALMTLGFLRALGCEIYCYLGRPFVSDEERADARRTRLLLLIAAFLPLAVFTLPGVPIFGGVKHWFTAMPPLVLLAAVEFDRLVMSVWKPKGRWTFASQGLYVLMALAFVFPGVLGIRLVHPYGIGFYNELIGSLRGAAERGMFRNFWGYTSRGNLEYLNQHVERGGKVFFQRTNLECYQAYQREGILRPDIQYAYWIGDADWATLHYQRTFANDEYRVWNDWGARAPVAGVYVDELPMNLVYRRNESRR